MMTIRQRYGRVGVARNGGFSLVELIVSAAITVVLAVLLVSVTSGMLSAWNRSRGKLTSSNQAKLALDQIAHDLEGAMFRNDERTWLAATILETNNPGATESNAVLESERLWIVSGTNSALIKPRSIGGGSDPRSFILDAPSIEDCAFGMAGVWFRFFTTKLDANTGLADLSAPTAVSYQINRRRVGGTGVTSECLYMLYRSVVRPIGATASAFQTGYELDPAASNAYTFPLDATDGNPSTVVRPNRAHVLANNVIDFGVRLFVREGSGLRLIFPAKPSVDGGAPVVGTSSDSTSSTVPVAELSHLARSLLPVDSSDVFRNRFPDVAEVMLRVLTDEGSSLIQNLEAGRIQGDWWDIALANSQTYVRRIELKGRGL